MSIRHVLLFASFIVGLAGTAQTPSAISTLPVRSRDEIIATAKLFAEYTWICKAANVTASCLAHYESDWKPDQRITGVPYDWGGVDSIEEFEAKLKKGFAAGSHSRDGISDCTAGIDCSGFVAFCWGQRSHKF